MTLEKTTVGIRLRNRLNKKAMKNIFWALSLCTILLTSVPSGVFAQDENFTLNLKNTDIHSLIATVSKQTGKNFVIDPRVKAKVTVVSAEPIGSEQLYQVFLSVLQVHGYSAVPTGDLIKIVPDVTAKQGPVPLLSNSDSLTDQLVTQVIPIVNVPASQLVPILRPLVPQQGHLAAYAATNSLIITDRSANIGRLTSIIKRIDRPDSAAIEVIQLNHASARELVRIIGSLESGGANRAGSSVGAMKLAADERTNSILVSGDQAARLRVRGLIANLDTPVESGGNTRVVYLKYADAADMVSVLNGVSQGQAKVGTSSSSNTGDAASGGVQTKVANTVSVEGAAPTTQPVRRARNTSNESSKPSVDIQADEHTNSLIITAPPDEMRNVLSVISQLDIRRAQVLVEAIIAELSESSSSAIGANYIVDGTDENRPAGYTNLGGATQSLAASIASNGASLNNGLSLALGRFGTTGVNFGFLLTAIASDADNNILSTPTLVTLDNQEAEIIVGQNLPFVTGQTLSSDNQNPFTTIERRDVGISLKVKPQINEGNNIKMEIQQDTESVSATTVAGASDITTDKRSIKTTVLVEDKQTLILGGLMDDQLTEQKEKVPFLGDIPILGNLFRYNSKQKSKRNLMVFLHPTIMRDAKDSDYYSDLKYNELRNKQLSFFDEEQNAGTDLNTPPVLPKLELYYQGQPVETRQLIDQNGQNEISLNEQLDTPRLTPADRH